MIFGIGTDIVDVLRIEKMESLDVFAKKILSESELTLYESFENKKQINYLAKQFAGKEAISKAFGTGIRNKISFQNIEILRDEHGKPTFNPLNGINDVIADLGIVKTHVSLADEKNYAIAFAILEK
jgi:holo-[acyl-carrier protein] synthase